MTTAQFDKLVTAANNAYLNAQNAKERRAATKELERLSRERRAAGK